MSSHKIENNIQRFEKRISNAILSLLAVFLITTILFAIISYQSYLQQKSLKLKDIDSAIGLFQNNLSEKLSIIASSNVFIDFFTSGISTREDLESRFLTELLPLRSSGITGYSLINLATKTSYQSGKTSDQSLAVKLCYLANRLDSENGNCYGVLKLFFSQDKIIKELKHINNSIQPCSSCTNYSLTKSGYFGNFLVDDQSQFDVRVTTKLIYDNTIYYYIFIIFILFGFALFNREKLRTIVKETISNPIDLLVQKIKTQDSLSEIPEALYEINYLSSQIEAGRLQINKINEYEKQAAIGFLAASVAHDIRSPLAVLEITMSSISAAIPNAQLSILSQAIQSVRDIANNLLEQHRSQNYKVNLAIIQENGNIVRPVLLSNLLEVITSQKRLEWQNNPCDIDLRLNTNARSAWVCVAPNDIKRTISNLLNNAYEALLSSRNIYISLDYINNQLLLRIKDTGHGIPQNKIKHVLNGMSLKHPGEGFGLSNAKKYLERIQGSLKLSSSALEGTVVDVKFVPCQKPTWFPDAITTYKDSIIIVLDDDASIHNLWRHRFQTLGIPTLHFVNSQSFFTWHQANEHSHHHIVYLIDYELRNDTCNGLEILSQIYANQYSYLITSHADEIAVQKNCEDLGIWLIPKNLSAEVEITLQS